MMACSYLKARTAAGERHEKSIYRRELKQAPCQHSSAKGQGHCQLDCPYRMSPNLGRQSGYESCDYHPQRTQSMDELVRKAWHKAI